MLFAAFVQEREPTRWSDLPNGFLGWVQDVGILAAVVLVPYLIVLLVRSAQSRDRPHTPTQTSTFPPALLGLALLGIGIGYAVALVGWLMGSDGQVMLAIGRLLGGACALATVAIPFLFNLLKLSWRRIWALARVSFKEAVRRRILWVFAFLLIAFLFFPWFMSPKEEDQVSGYVGFISVAMAILLLLPAAVLGSFGIPTDLMNQTIHTIVTKPVERFEIYLGRFLGQAMLLTLVLFAMTALSLVYVLRGVSEEAKYESLRARVPLFGELTLEPKGENLSVGREWEYRKYIAGGDATHKAVWTYASLPSDLANRTSVPCEFTFDIFRTTKGVENVGVMCMFEFKSGRFQEADLPKYLQERDELLRRADADPEQVDGELSAKYGYYVMRSKEITDYHTEMLQVPAGVFQHALAGEPPADPDPEKAGRPGPRLRVVVRCESRTQYVGMAKRDLYLLDQERSAYFNFFKGAAGLWLLLCLVLGVSVACSTQLSGVISFILTGFLLVVGMLPDFVVDLARGTVEGGGPAQSAVRLARGVSPTIPLEASPGRSLAEGADAVYQTLFTFVRMIVPDVGTYDLSEYVAKGFNVALVDFSGEDLLVKAILLLGYLLPWSIAAYYLFEWREVAA